MIKVCLDNTYLCHVYFPTLPCATYTFSQSRRRGWMHFLKRNIPVNNINILIQYQYISFFLVVVVVVVDVVVIIIIIII